jgi:hypothetical protein
MHSGTREGAAVGRETEGTETDGMLTVTCGVANEAVNKAAENKRENGDIFRFFGEEMKAKIERILIPI